MSRVLSLAGFQVTLIGRFWVTPEGNGVVDSMAGHPEMLRTFAEAHYTSSIGLPERPNAMLRVYYAFL